MTAVRLEHISKRFGQTVALEDVSLEVARGELFFLLGPSGCGKSTLLRVIAGLEEPSGGRVIFNGRDVTSVGTEGRGAVMVFQSYALWPHMTVEENVGFGLEVRKVSRGERAKRVKEVLELVRMGEYGGRRPGQLSGGQQQRVALARALAVRPEVLLLDEPLSNLDAKLREEMRREIRRICKEGGFTAVYVTHDQKEALSVADRVGVMDRGRLVQVGGPGEVYERPVNSFVASFIGQTNLISGVVKDVGVVESGAGVIRSDTAGFEVGRKVIVSVRPERIRVSGHGRDARATVNNFPGRVVETVFFGETSEHLVEVGRERVRVVSAPAVRGAEGDVTIAFEQGDAVVLAE